MIGKVLKSLRICNDLSINELARNLNISPSYISEIENEKKDATLKIIEKYSIYFEVSKASLLYLAEEGEKNKYTYKEMLFKILERIVTEDK